MKKVFFIDPQSYNNLAMYDYEILSRISDRRVIFFGNKLYAYKSIPGIKFIKTFSYSKYKNKFQKIFSYLKSLFYIFYKAVLERPTTIHIQWIRIPQLDYYYYKYLKKIVNTRLIYTVHNILPHNYKKNDRKDYLKFYNLCDGLIVHTVTSKEKLVSEFGISCDKIFVAPHGPLKYHNSLSQIDVCVKKFKEDYRLSDKIIFSMLGSQSYYKGTDIVIKGWLENSFLCNNPNAILLIGGEYKEGNMANVSCESIRYIPKRFSDLEFASLMKLTDVLLLPYRRIDQSGLLLTAITQRIPFCASRCGELTKPIEIANIGWIIDELTPSGVASLLTHIVSNPKEIRDRQEDNSGWICVDEYYDWSNNVAATLKAYDVR